MGLPSLDVLQVKVTSVPDTIVESGGMAVRVGLLGGSEKTRKIMILIYPL